ncbi:SCO family protein [Roseiconus lacunae]|uniref:SCO family protein n=1 Tax=Roseiconus lacunae TaxID=2605694 RepID=A0ABT7PII9_9BACT|nr:SCO family protein [Roseiconus lacunae]MCD0458419.1 SCO family protein [Roseiconus lacunae]MDM4016307.1 SCO family protein [Roseiconus lacunae]WRQ52090.1 SCO family protein [Stieleria sp. HD01]
MKTAGNIAIILVLGIVLGFIGRSMRTPAPSGPGPDDIVHTNEVAPGEEPLVTDSTEIANDDIARPAPQTTPIPGLLTEFELTERSGETVRSEDLKGQPYIVSFFFTTCPSICPQQNQKLKTLADKYKGKGIKFLAISVDPETDTPEVLREYAARFNADADQWLFLTGDLLYIRRIAGDIFQQPVNKGFHTERFVLVDAEGNIEGFYSWPEPKQMEKLEQAIEEMI